MTEKRLDPGGLDIVSVGIGLSEIICSLRRSSDIVAVTVTINSMLNVVKGGIKALWQVLSYTFIQCLIGIRPKNTACFSYTQHLISFFRSHERLHCLIACLHGLSLKTF